MCAVVLPRKAQVQTANSVGLHRAIEGIVSDLPLHRLLSLSKHVGIGNHFGAP